MNRLVRGQALFLSVLVTASSLFALAAPVAATPPQPLAVYSLEPIPGLEYIAVAPRAFADSLQPLIDWKTDKGVPAQVIVLEDAIAPPTSGRDDAEKLHNFLHGLYLKTGGTAKWLLLVGDGDWDNPFIPLREVFTNSQHDGDLFNGQNWYTTDTYYGNLESSWDEDGDGIFGELNEGDWTPELYVGRVPVDNVSEVRQWVARQVTYETNPPSGIWMRRGILAGALMDRPNVLDNPFTSVDEGYDPFTDNGRKVDEEVASESPAWMELDRYYDYPQWDGGMYSSSTDNLRVGTVKSAIDAGAAFLLMEGHGYSSNRGVAQYDDPSGTKSIWRSDGEEPALRWDEVLNLTNGDMLPFVYISACYTGDFTDRDDTSMEAFLKTPGGGAIAVVAGNGENFRLENVSGQQGFGNWWLAHEFFHMLFVEGYSQPGKVLGDLKARYQAYYTSEGPPDVRDQDYFRAERVSYNLMGDPEFSMVMDYPATLSATPIRQPFVSENSVQIQVAGRDGALAGALVHLTGPHGEARARTNGTGVALLSYPFSDLAAYNLTVTAPGHLPLHTTLAPATPDHNLAFAPASLVAPTTVRRGDSVEATGTVTARGLAPYSNVIVEFRTGNPVDGPTIGALSLASVAPGNPVAVSMRLSFDMPGDFLVYATIDPASEQVEDTDADNVAFASIHVDFPPQFAALPVITLPAGGLLSGALNFPSYVADRDDGALGLAFRVAAVSDPRLTAAVQGTMLNLEASPDAPSAVTVTLEARDAFESAHANLTVTITRGNALPVVEPVMEAEALVREPFTLQLQGADPEGLALAWSDNSPLFDVQLGGRIAFTPTADQVGRYAVTVTASDGRASASHTFLLVVSERVKPLELRNLPIVRASPGHEVVIDLNAISPDPDVTFVTDRQDVAIDAASRVLRYTPAPGEARVDSIRLTAVKAGGSPSIVLVTVDVAAAPPGSADALWFAGAAIAIAAVVGLTLARAHQGRLKDEKIFKVDGRPPKGGTSSEKGSAGRSAKETAAAKGSEADTSVDPVPRQKGDVQL